MMKAVDFKSIAIFFFFCFLDEKKSLAATSKAIKIFRSKYSKNPEVSANIHMIRASMLVFEELQKEKSKIREQGAFSSHWSIPKNIDLNPWKEFQKLSKNEEMTAVIWSKILNFSDQEIADALNLSVGTIRHRVGQGLSFLGSSAMFPGQGLQRRSHLDLVKR